MDEQDDQAQEAKAAVPRAAAVATDARPPHVPLPPLSGLLGPDDLSHEAEAAWRAYGDARRLSTAEAEVARLSQRVILLEALVAKRDRALAAEQAEAADAGA